MAQQTIGNGESGLIVRNKLNENFIEVYGRNDFTDIYKDKLDGIEEDAEVNVVDSVNGETGAVVLDSDDIDDASATNKFTNQTDINRLANTSGENTGDMSNADVKTAYEANANTNEFTDAEKSNLANTSGINTGDQQTLGLDNTNVDFSYTIQTYAGYLHAIDCIVTNRPGKMNIDSENDTWQVSNELMGVSSEALTWGETGKTTEIEFRLMISDSDSNSQSFGLSEDNFYSAYTNTDNSVCFTLDGSTLYAKNANGTATLTDISSGITVSNWNVYKISWTPGSEAKFYVNGVLKATHASNLPTTGDVKLGFGGTTNGQSQRVSSIVCIQKI